VELIYHHFTYKQIGTKSSLLIAIQMYQLSVMKQTVALILKNSKEPKQIQTKTCFLSTTLKSRAEDRVDLFKTEKNLILWVKIFFLMIFSKVINHYFTKLKKLKKRLKQKL